MPKTMKKTHHLIILTEKILNKFLNKNQCMKMDQSNINNNNKRIAYWIKNFIHNINIITFLFKTYYNYVLFNSKITLSNEL